MKNTTILTLALISAPAALFAQQPTASASAASQASVDIPANYSAQAKANIEASFKRAQEKKVPDQALRQRLAEGQAKTASDAQVASSIQKTEERLEASQSALVRAGRTEPSPEDINAGEQAIARGATDAHVEALAKHAPADRSLVVAFDVLGKLQAQGKPVDQALAEIAAKLDAHANDEVLSSLTGGAAATGAPNASSSAATGATSPVGGAAAGVGAAVKGAAAGVGGAVSGAVSGSVPPKKP